MHESFDDQVTTISVVPGRQGAEFDRMSLRLPAGATTVWKNRTGTEQVIVPDNSETRRVMTLAPGGEDGAVWMMQMRSSQRQTQTGGTFRWRLQSNDAASITIVVDDPPTSDL